MKKVSDKRAKELIQYKQLREKWFENENNQFCYACCTLKHYHPDATPTRNLCIHHTFGRENKLLNDTSKWKTLCFFHNNFVETSTNWARENGLKFK